jgi:hypothetical protein
LKGNHGADLGAIKNVKQEGLNDIVFVVAEGDLIAFETMGKMEQAFSPFPGAKETGVFSILGAVCPRSDIGELDVERESSRFTKFLQDFGSPGINPSTLQPEGWSLLRVNHERAFDLALKSRAWRSRMVKAKVDINWEEIVMNENPFASLMEEVKERQAVLSSRDPHQDSVSSLDQPITVDGFPHQAPNLFFPVRHNPKPRMAQSA